MAEAYRNQADLNQRIDSSICTWDGVPYYVRAYDVAYPEVALYKLDSKLYKPYMKVDHTDDRFVDRSPSLGYLNYMGHCFYISRMPYRRYNQGLRSDSIESICGNLPRDHRWFTSAAMSDCILGVYPSLRKARQTLDIFEATGVAVHRHIALKYIDRRLLGMYYRDRLVALWNTRTKAWDYQDPDEYSIIRKIIRKTGLF